MGRPRWSRRRSLTAAGGALALVGAALPVLGAGGASAQPISHGVVVSENPQNNTPNIQPLPHPLPTDPSGEGDAVVQMPDGDTVVVGGQFNQVAVGGVKQTRTNLVAFSKSNGHLVTSFNPTVDGQVNALVPSADGAAVYVGGAFSNVNGVAARRLVKLDLATGRVSGLWKSPGFDGLIRDVALVDGQLVVAGSFAHVGSTARTGLASLNPSTGALTSFVNLTLASSRVTTSTAPLGVTKLAVRPDGSRIVIIGSFNSVNGFAHAQIAVIDTSVSPATLSMWTTTAFSPTCAPAFPAYLRSVDFDPTGQYFAVVGSGGAVKANPYCDSATRWELSPETTGRTESWRDDSGGDSMYAVGVTGEAVYLGGHIRWMNNPSGNNTADQGAAQRWGIAALDPRNGMPLAWNPSRDRGTGIYDFTATSDGLWFADDSCGFAGETHCFVKFLPTSGGYSVAGESAVGLPATLLRVGPFTGSGYANRIDVASFTGTKGTITSTGATSGRWASATGAFRINNSLFAATRTALLEYPLTGNAVSGAATSVNLTPPTGGVAFQDFLDDMASMTSLAYDNGRMYFTLAGQSRLYMRYFEYDSRRVGGAVGALRYTIAAANPTGASYASAAGSFVAGGNLYLAQTDGTLRKLPMTRSQGTLTPNGSATTIGGPAIDGINWRARGITSSN